ncbi:MAG TPA: hypothetical protein VK437_08905 [Steroidobacteraceae bacterium]|nr:hypothetical protein [Steroidobacteraceae bacterium]
MELAPVSVADGTSDLDNCTSVIRFLSVRYADLLDSQALEFVRTFERPPQPARALLVRMMMRKRILFRARQLVYEEIGDATVAARALVDRGWIDANPPLTVDELFQVLTLKELRSCLPVPAYALRGCKAAMLERSRRWLPEVRVFAGWCRGSSETVYRLTLSIDRSESSWRSTAGQSAPLSRILSFA